MVIDYNEVLFNELCNRNFSRLGCVFQTNEEAYFYDTGTSKVFACEDLEFQILKQLLETSSLSSLDDLNYSRAQIEKGLYSIQTLIEEEHILSRPFCDKFAPEELEDKTYIKEVILELSQQCNLRCRYCVFNEDFEHYRNFENKHMEWDTAKKAIDYAANNCDGNLFIGFYGGEPLLNFDLMKRCIEYVSSTYANFEIFYSMTTNLTLVNDEIAHYLSKLKNITILCSMDGPKEIHDQFRLNHGKSGSFAQTMQGLKKLVQAFGERAKDVLSVNTVVCPPFDENKFNQLKYFFEQSDIFPNGMKFQYTYVSTGSLKDVSLKVTEIPMEQYFQQDFEIVDPFKYIAMQHICNHENNYYEMSVEALAIMKIHNRLICEYPLSVMTRNGCCRPGSRRLYVTVDGAFKVCEKVGESPAIGNINEGINQSVINRIYYQEYDNLSIEKCNNCWAANLCDACYASCMNHNGIDQTKKDNVCHSIRTTMRNNLIEYHEILLRRPQVIEEVAKIYDIFD